MIRLPVAVDPVKHADAIAGARAYLEASQFSEHNGLAEAGRGSPYYGGFGYDKTGTRPDADMSNSQFALQALKASGLPEDHPAYKRVQAFLSRSQKRTESNDLEELECVLAMRRPHRIVSEPDTFSRANLHLMVLHADAAEEALFKDEPNVAARAACDGFLAVDVFTSQEPLFAQKARQVGRDSLIGQELFIIEVRRDIEPVDAHGGFAQLRLQIHPE